jgi:hypothetical protein
VVLHSLRLYCVFWNRPNSLWHTEYRTYLMRLCHPPDGSTSPKFKLLCFITTTKICKEKNALAFNWDRCCHLVLCLRLIPFHWNVCKHLILIENTFNLHFLRRVKSFWSKLSHYFSQAIPFHNCIYLFIYVWNVSHFQRFFILLHPGSVFAALHFIHNL